MTRTADHHADPEATARAVDMPALWTGQTLPTAPWTARRRPAHMPTAPTATSLRSPRTRPEVTRLPETDPKTTIPEVYGEM